MSRAKGTANLAASLEVLAGAPLDAREKVPTKADLYLAANFPYPYVGLETYVVAENKKYRLIGNDVTVEANWEEIGSGGGGGGTTVVANPEGEATDDLEKLQVGNDIYSIPEENVEMNKAQFDALPAATKNNGKAYFIPDANILTNFTVMGNRFDKANIYDTTERMIGRWIDGKPLYQKVINNETATTISVSSWTAIPNAPSNIDNIISIDMLYSIQSTRSCFPLLATLDNGVVKAKPSGNTNYGGNVFVFKYTKTTDASVAIGTENDYSTDEMIIGTWVDGKPVYQRTLDCGALPNSSTKEVDHNISNIGQIVYHYGMATNTTDGTRLVLPYVSIGNLNNCIALTITDTKIRIGTGSSRSSYNSTYVTIQYTKTTD